MWSSGVVGCIWLFADELVPHISVAVESALVESIDLNIVSSQYPGRRLVLKTDRERVVQPVLDIRTPLDEYS